ncbi:hypothetical protein ABBQ38_004637 [Trebouxia sp. C0009 RCD-2024]
MSSRRLVAIRDVAALLARNASNAHRSYACAAYMPSTKQGNKAPWGAATAAVVGLAYWFYNEQPARCLNRQLEPDESITEVQDACRLQHWLASVGANLDAVEIRDSQHAEAGLGVFASDSVWKPLQVSWWKQPWYRWRKPNDGIILATFPLHAAITPQTILSDPVLGSTYQELLNIGVLDERALILLFLTVERQLGEDSVWHPWISILPQKLNTPLFYSDEDLAELKGTSLEEAVGVQKWQLGQAWKRLQPACSELLDKSGSFHQQPTFEDFMWAHSIFHSRSLAFPEPQGVNGHVSSTPQEGIIPGLDFCNHRESSAAKWTIFGTPGLKLDGSGMPTVVPTEVALVCPRQQAPKAGQEVTINYGDKGNEMLLMSYGFTQSSNLHDVLMIKCPVAPPEDRDQLLQARLALLRSRGLAPQLFLPADLLEVRPTRTSADRRLRLPKDVEQALKILVMMPKQLASQLASEEELGPADNTLDAVEQSGERMAVLTTLVGLLELKHLQMEGEDGTGSLESDIQLIEAEQDDADGGTMSETKRACLIYRSSQKRIAREYLIMARQELHHELNRLHKLKEAEDSNSQGKQ